MGRGGSMAILGVGPLAKLRHSDLNLHCAPTLRQELQLL